MGQLADINRQLALANGQGVAPTQDDLTTSHVSALVEAIQSVELSESKRQDYTKALEGIAKAISGSSKGYDALVKAISKIEVKPEFTVTSPAVTVEAPEVEVNCEFQLPEQDRTEYVIKRDDRGQVSSIVAQPYVEPAPKKPNYTIK